MKRQGISTPFMVAVVALLLSMLILGMQTDQLLGLEEKAVERTLPLVADRVEAVMIAVHDLDRIEVEMQLQREMNLSVENGSPELSLNDAEQPVQTGMEYSVEEGRSDSLCVRKKPGSVVELAAEGC